ncbi:hypothetical protein [Streptomyces sp. NPDC001274]
MTAMTITTAILGGQDPDYYAGRADAYDDHHTGTTLDTLITRLGYLIDEHPNTGYVTGYADRVWEIHREQHAVASAEAELAHTFLAGAA